MVEIHEIIRSICHPVQRTPVESGVEGSFNVDIYVHRKDSSLRSE